MNIRFIRSAEKKKIIEKLNEQFGIESLPYLLIETGKERIRGFSGSLSKDEIAAIALDLSIEGIGLYLIREEHDLRLGFDATQLLGNEAKKNIVEIDETQLAFWLRGRDIDVDSPQGTVIIRHGEDYIGCGKSTGNRIINHVPKERRLKK